MEMNEMMQYMSEYGLLFIGIIIFLEYLNLPGFPAGIIMPVAGIWAAGAEIGFVMALVVSVGAALVASWLLYVVGWYGGDVLLKKYMDKFPSQRATIEKQMHYLQTKGSIGVFVSKLIPMVRTIISIPAGVIKLNFLKYTISSALGIAIWNGVLMGCGYFFGQEVLSYFMSGV